MRLLKNTSIKQRLTLIIMAISGASVLLTTIAISVFGVNGMRDNIAKELNVLAVVVGDRNIAALQFRDDKLAQEALGVFTKKETIVQACLYDESGAFFQSYASEQHTDSQCPTDTTERTVWSDSRIELIAPIYGKRADGETAKFGYIYIESTLDEVEQYIHKQGIIALSIGVAGFLLSYLLAIHLQRGISRPILNLADTARQVSALKDYSIRAKTMGSMKHEDKNELVILTESFNEMLSEIGARSDQLKKQNIELEKAKDVAESANRAKSHFLANISHELRTPLNAVIGFSSILMNQLFGPLGDQKYLEYAKDINESGGHLLDIINDILDLSKAEAGRLEINYEEVHIGKAINKCVTIVAERAEKAAVTITTDVPKMLPPLVADRLRFIQIILNILSNAIKFTQEGGKVHIAVRTTEAHGEITGFVISIQDSGIGMSEADIHQAFQSFGQVDSGLNRKYEGTGLGLPLTKKLMELHHGSIGIESQLGKGTTVSLTFPALTSTGTKE